MSQENVEVVRRAYGRLAEDDALGDWSWFFEDFAHDSLELRPGGVDYHGRERWTQFGRDFSAVWDEWYFDSDAFQFFDGGETVVQEVRGCWGRCRGEPRSRPADSRSPAASRASLRSM